MKFRELVAEGIPAAARDRTLKKIEQYNQEVQIAIEKTGKAPAKIQKELNRLVAAFPEWADYQAEKVSAARIAAHGDMMARVKTAEFGAGNSENYIAAEANEEDLAIRLEMLRDVVGQLDDDMANVISSFNTKARTGIRPTKEEMELAKAVIARAEELGIIEEYRARVVTKLDKHKKPFAYDSEAEDA